MIEPELRDRFQFCFHEVIGLKASYTPVWGMSLSHQHQQNVCSGPDVTWLALVPLNPLVHHPVPRSRRFTRTLGPRSWTTLPSSQLYLVHNSRVLANPGPPFPCPGHLISLPCLFYPILHLPHIRLLFPDLCLPQPSAILVYRPRPPVYGFLISITFCS